MEGFKHSGIRRLTVDVTNEEDVREAIDFIVEEEGKIDIVVSNAGTLCIGTLEHS
jgi:1-acylglycerone phosphate reductase